MVPKLLMLDFSVSRKHESSSILSGVEFWSASDWNETGSGLVVRGVERGEERSTGSTWPSSFS
jgi:hypothetical protein